MQQILLKHLPSLLTVHSGENERKKRWMDRKSLHISNLILIYIERVTEEGQDRTGWEEREDAKPAMAEPSKIANVLGTPKTVRLPSKFGGCT